MKKTISMLLLCILLNLSLTACSETSVLYTGSDDDNDNVIRYSCDVQSLNWNTEIHISGNDRNFVIRGDIFTFVEDPLTMYENDDKVGYAGDAYHFVAQDSHTIYVGDSPMAEMVGEVELFGELYTIYDMCQNKIGTLKLHYGNVEGELTDSNNKLIANYYSEPFMNDFTVTIVNNEVMSDEVILMLFASYYSDYDADRN